MYIKAWRNKKNSLAAQSCAVAGGGKAPVSACKPLCARFRAGVACVPAFTRESERRPFVGEVEKCDEERFETAL